VYTEKGKKEIKIK